MTRTFGEGRAQNALVVMSNPAESSLTREISTAIIGTWRAQGYHADMVDLFAEGFDPVFGPADHAAFIGTDEMPDAVRAEQRRIDRADHLILVYPVYWWAMPALLKGWIDRVFVAGWAFDEDGKGRITKKLGRLKVSLIAIAAASDAIYTKRGYRDAMQVQIETGIFDFCGASVVSSKLVTPDQLAQPSAPQAIANAVITDCL